MPLEPGRLRRWIIGAALALMLILAGFYSYARHLVRRRIHDLPGQLGFNIQQSANGFSISKSEGGHTIFTLRADKAVQFKNSSHAELQNASIIVYGKRADRYDQIYGSKFEYDPNTGEVIAQGVVQIDLQSNAAGPSHPDQAPPDEVKNPIHLKTSGLTFNQKTGLAHTSELVEFNLPQGHGTARGADFDSNAGLLTLGSAVNFSAELPGDNHTEQRTELKADHAVFSQHDSQIRLDRVELRQADPGRQALANKVVITLYPDNTLQRVEANGDIYAQAVQGQQQSELRAAEAGFQVLEGNHWQNAVLTGNVTVSLKRAGQPDTNSRADRVELIFGAKNQLEKIHATGGVDVVQSPQVSATQAADSRELKADGLNAEIRDGNRLVRVVTSGAAQVILLSPQNPALQQNAALQNVSSQNTPSQKPMGGNGSHATQTVITAGTLTARFDANNRVQSVHGEPDSRIVSTAPGAPDRITTAERLDVEFGASSGAKGSDTIQSATQEGNFHYQEGTREAWAQRARFVAANNQLTLSGSPRVADAQSSISAQEISLNQATGEIAAHGDVRGTYLNNKPQPNGGMLSAGDATHVIAPVMHANSKTGIATFSGGARLWQASNAVDAPQIEFSKNARTIAAHGNDQQTVVCSFLAKSQGGSGNVTPGKAAPGKFAPMRITAAQLTYSDVQRRARFSGGVKASGEDGSMQAGAMDVLLKPANAKNQVVHNNAVQNNAAQNGSGNLTSGGSGTADLASAGAGSIDQIVATGNVTIEQRDRHASGDRLIYLADSGETTLTGSPGHLPSMTDPEHGTVTGDSLTFNNRDDRVVVESSGTTRTITQTQVKK